MDPQSFEVKPSAGDLANYSTAILHGYRSMDTLLGKLLRLVGSSATIIFCTALSQQPYLKAEATGGRNYYRFHNPGVLREKLRVPGEYNVKPVMAEQFLLSFQTREEACSADVALAGYQIEGNPAFHTTLEHYDLMVQCNYTREPHDGLSIVHKKTGESLPMSEVFYHFDVLKSGFHHPHGMLWIRRAGGVHKVYKDVVPLVNVAPTVLALCGSDLPAYMARDLFSRKSLEFEVATAS
jgi:hypothetical protein